MFKKLNHNLFTPQIDLRSHFDKGNDLDKGGLKIHERSIFKIRHKPYTLILYGVNNTLIKYLLFNYSISWAIATEVPPCLI